MRLRVSNWWRKKSSGAAQAPMSVNVRAAAPDLCPPALAHAREADQEHDGWTAPLDLVVDLNTVHSCLRHYVLPVTATPGPTSGPSSPGPSVPVQELR